MIINFVLTISFTGSSGYINDQFICYVDFQVYILTLLHGQRYRVIIWFVCVLVLMHMHFICAIAVKVQLAQL